MVTQEIKRFDLACTEIARFTVPIEGGGGGGGFQDKASSEEGGGEARVKRVKTLHQTYPSLFLASDIHLFRITCPPDGTLFSE